MLENINKQNYEVMFCLKIEWGKRLHNVRCKTTRCRDDALFLLCSQTIICSHVFLLFILFEKKISVYFRTKCYVFVDVGNTKKRRQIIRMLYFPYQHFFFSSSSFFSRFVKNFFIVVVMNRMLFSIFRQIFIKP